MLSYSILHAQHADDVIRIACDAAIGKTCAAQMSMKIIRGKAETNYVIKKWSKGDTSLAIAVTYPKKKKNLVVIVQHKKDFLNWTISSKKTTAMADSNFVQTFMGSDITLGELLNEKSLLNDYRPGYGQIEIITNKSCWIMNLSPKPDVKTNWSKVILWVDRSRYVIMKAEYYSKDSTLSHTVSCLDTKLIGDKEFAAKLEIVPANHTDWKTIITTDKVVYDKPIDNSKFDQQNLQKLQ